jgi:uncharacterized protein (TIGR02391 family)
VPREFTLTEDQVLELPVDQLGLEILRDVIANPDTGDNARNWVRSAVYGAQAKRALSEAWSWLHANGLIATDVEDHNLHQVFATRLGERAAEEGLAVVRAHQRLAMDLHPRLEARVRPQYLMGEWELASLAALREVEIRVRALAGESSSSIGVNLMRAAFRLEGGPLWEPSLDRGEAVGRMELFAGAIGLLKNPTSHREVSFDDPTEAAEIILVADLLMRILDRVETKVEARRA